VVGEWKGEDDQTVIMAFGKDGWFEMRNHKGEETDPDTLRRIQANEEFDKAHGITTGPPPTKTPETEEDKAIREETERIIRERGNQYRKSEGVPNMRYKIDDDEDPVWLDIIAFDKAGKPMLTIKCIMKHPKNNKDKMIIKFPVDYTQLLGHIPLDISRYDRPTSFSGQEENRIKLLRKATLAVKGLLRLEDTGLDEHGYIISSPDIRVGETPTPESKPASTPESEEDKAIREVKEQVLKEGTK